MKSKILKSAAVLVLIFSIGVIAVESSQQTPTQMTIKLPVQTPYYDENSNAQSDQPQPTVNSNGVASVTTYLNLNDIADISPTLKDIQLIRYVEYNGTLNGIFISQEALNNTDMYNDNGEYTLVTRLSDDDKTTQISQYDNNCKINVRLDLSQIKHALDQIWQTPGKFYTIEEQVFDYQEISLVISFKSLQRLQSELEKRNLTKFAAQFTVASNPVQE